MSDRIVELQSKFATAMLTGMCKAFGIKPTVPGLIAGMGGDPEKVFELVRFVQANGERLTNSFEAAVTGTAARVERMEYEQARQAALLDAIARKLDVDFANDVRWPEIGVTINIVPAVEAAE